MKATTRTKLITILSTVESRDFKEVYVLVAEARKRLAQNLITTFKVGDQVSFDAGRRGTLTGLIIKLNQTTAKVQIPRSTSLPDSFTPLTWRVAVVLLKKV